MNEWMDGRMEGWLDGRVHPKINIHPRRVNLLN